MLRVLFVDDEPRILSGLRNALRRLRGRWLMSFASGPEEALALLETSAFDVVVSDMRMPGMDGAALLAIVQERWGNTVRIVLSGYAEAAATIRAVPVAHQMLMKPCSADKLEEVIERSVGLRALVGDDPIQAAIARLGELPPVPKVYAELAAAINDDTSSAVRVARIVERDVALTVKVLQLVNSAFFANASAMRSVEQAVIRLGLDTMRQLVVTAELFSGRIFSNVDGAVLERLQHHAVRSAQLARALAAPEDAAEAALTALVHDVGKLVFASLDSEFSTHSAFCVAADAATSRIDDDVPAVIERERERYGVTHPEAGAYLLGLWAFGDEVVNAVANHHHPLNAGTPARVARAAILHVACAFADHEACDKGCSLGAVDPNVAAHAELGALVQRAHQAALALTD
jgi:HD-like signal output (HDOD) protein